MPSKGDDKTKDLVCSFCGKGQEEVRKLIAGPTVYICDECIDLCNDIIAEECDQEEAINAVSSVPKPTDIRKVLDQYVVGQDHANIGGFRGRGPRQGYLPVHQLAWRHGDGRPGDL